MRVCLRNDALHTHARAWHSGTNTSVNSMGAGTDAKIRRHTLHIKLAGCPIESIRTLQGPATFLISGSPIVVSLNNNANGFVIADAVPIEKR